MPENTVTCGACCSTYSIAMLKKRLKKDTVGEEQESTECPNPGCTAVVYREVNGKSVQCFPSE